MKKYTVAIIGAGSIGANKPDKYDSPETENILTHAHACYNHPAINKMIFVDNDYKRLVTAYTKWKTYGYGDIDVMFEKNIPDIIIVATPTSTHHQILSKISYHNPKLVIAEKPFCNNYKEAYEIVSLYKAKEIPLLVDYIRRYELIHQQIKLDIDNGVLGNIQNVRVLYNRGLKHEGCHAIDLMNWWFMGDWGIQCKTRIDSHQEIIDYSIKDPTYSIHLDYKKCPNVIFQPCDGREFSIFEIDIVGTKKRYRLINHGLELEISHRKPEPTYGDYDCLGLFDPPIKTQLQTALYELIDNAVDYLNDSNTKLICTGDDALKVHEVYERLVS